MKKYYKNGEKYYRIDACDEDRHGSITCSGIRVTKKSINIVKLAYLSNIKLGGFEICKDEFNDALHNVLDKI